MTTPLHISLKPFKIFYIEIMETKHFFLLYPVAEASCRSAIDAARNIVADLGPSAVARSGGLTELARCKDTNSERDCNRIMVKKYRLALPIQKTYLKTEDPSLKIPILPMSSWAAFLAKHNCFHVLCGLIRPDRPREEAILKRFWSLFRKACPTHQVFKLAEDGVLQLERTAPVVMHGDEGRGRKHRAYMVVSFRGLLGRGLHASEKDKASRGVKKKYLKMKCNYIGHSFTTRFMIAGLQKSVYTGANAHVWKSLLSHCATEASALGTTGFTDSQGVTRWMMMLHITGDWPFLHKSGSFGRSFHNCQKNKIQQAGRGICHQCQAGQPHAPFEQIATRRPHWLQTEFVQSPFEEESPFRIVPHIPDKLPALWAFDYFHTWHLGVAKVWIGSILAMMAQLENGGQGNIDAKFAALSRRYTDWCCQNKYRAHVQKLSKDMIAWQKTSLYPCGTWHKGELTTVLMKFLEHALTAQAFTDPLMDLVRDGTVSINRSISAMYKADLWLTKDECFEIAGHGFRFLRRLSELTHQCFLQNRNLFCFTPKVHVLHKIYLKVHTAATSDLPHLNPLSLSVQQCEDFIGRPSRLSRRVAGGAKASERVQERYLQATYSEWVQAGYLIRPLWHLEIFSFEPFIRECLSHWKLEWCLASIFTDARGWVTQGAAEMRSTRRGSGKMKAQTAANTAGMQQLQNMKNTKIGRTWFSFWKPSYLCRPYVF